MSDRPSDVVPPQNPSDEDASQVSEDAFISPDEPITRGHVPDDAFISPDDPIVRRQASTDGSVAVGMSGRQPASSDAGVLLDPTFVAFTLEAVARTLREDGFAAGLEVGPGTSHFEAVLKAYLKGYFSAQLKW